MSDTDELRAELDALRERVRELEAGLPASGNAPPSGEVRTNRRQALRLATGAAVGAIGAATIARPVAADDPNDVTLGSVKSTANRPTGSRYTGNSSGVGALFAAGDGASGTSAEFSAALGAWSHSATMPNGLYGFAEQPGATGVVGKNDTGASGIGVRGIGRTTGVRGETRSLPGEPSWGVFGEGFVGVEGEGQLSGVRGTSVGGFTGVVGIGANGGDFTGELRGVIAHGDSYGVAASGGLANLYLSPNSPTPPSMLGGPDRLHGEIAADGLGDLWYCIETGIPGTWRKLTGRTAAGAFHPIGPVRVYDSRLSAFTPSGPMAADEARKVSVADGYDIDGNVTDADVVPAGATSVALNITVTETGAANFLSVTPGGAAAFQSSTINWWQPGLTLANGTTVPLGSDRDLLVWSGPGGSTHFLIDVAGYWR